jgi:hypothetical protein
MTLEEEKELELRKLEVLVKTNEQECNNCRLQWLHHRKNILAKKKKNDFTLLMPCQVANTKIILE